MCWLGPWLFAGSALYYDQFMRHLSHAFHGRVDVMAMSHAGHSPTVPNPSCQLWSLEEQVVHLKDFLEEHVLIPGRPPLILMGHSIGAWMALKAVATLEAQLEREGRLQQLPRIIKVCAGAGRAGRLGVGRPARAAGFTLAGGALYA